jgi:hypothetical protein
MIKISRKTKLELFKLLKNENNVFGPDTGDQWILGFLGDIWNLREMPSEDDRFKNAYEDVYQHTVNNNDWEIDYLFIDRLKLLESDDIYVKFIETILNPKFKTSEDEITKFVLLINPYLEKEGLTLIINDYNEEGSPIYQIQVASGSSFPRDLKQNNINIYVVKNPFGNSTILSSHSVSDITPSFVLVFNAGWNDYGYKTEFSLFYYDNNRNGIYIGTTKITNGEANHTDEIISTEFKFLNESFCSLGQDYNYYTKLKEVAQRDFESILYSLRDAAFFTKIQDKFEKNPIFRIFLIRYDKAERLLREAKHIIYGYDLSNLYSFKYQFHPLFSKDSVEIDFNFDNNSNLPSRIYAIIGKNGTGKTQLVTSIPINISQKRADSFTPRISFFSKVIAVSYNIFDNFEIPQKTSSFNYIYCGLLDDKREVLSARQLILCFHKIWKRIEEKNKPMEENTLKLY